MDKKRFSRFFPLSVIVLIFVFTTGFPGCNKLTVSSLKANSHLKKANAFYEKEKYRDAIDEYERAIKFNPDLEVVFKYLGNCYSQIYRPGKDNTENKKAGENAVLYLLKARHAFPNDEDAIYALNDIYDKMGNFEKAEKYLLMILEKKPNDPNVYYYLAEFYRRNNQKEKAESMFEKRIALDPKNPDGYHRYAAHLAGMRNFDKAIAICEKRIYAIYDPEILSLLNDVEKMKSELEMIEGIEKNMDTVRKHKRLDQKERERLLNDANERLQKFRAKDEIVKEAAKKETEMKKRLGYKIEKITALSGQAGKDVIDALYTLGYLCWEKCYYGSSDIMDAENWTKIIDKGIKAINTVLKIEPEHDMALVCLNLLYRQKCTPEPLKCNEYLAKAKILLEKAKRIRERKHRREIVKKELAKMGKTS